MTSRCRRHSSCDLSDTETDLKRHRLADISRGQSKLQTWRNSQQSISRALTPEWTGITEVKKRASTSDLNSSNTEIPKFSDSTLIIQSFESFCQKYSRRSEKLLKESDMPRGTTSDQAEEPSLKDTSGDLFEVSHPRYQDVGLLLTLGESNSPCSRKDEADTDLALIFKHTHFT